MMDPAETPPSPPTRAFVHEGSRVRFQDVDHAGIVFFAKIFEYCHVAYEEFVEQALGLTPKEFFEARRLGAPLVATRSDHRHPLFHGDRMRIECRVGRLGRSSMAMNYQIFNQDNMLCALVEMKHAFVTTAEGRFESVAIPEGIRASLMGYLAPEEEAAPGR